MSITFGVPRRDIIRSSGRVNSLMFSVVYRLYGGCLVYWFYEMHKLCFCIAWKQTHNIFASLYAFDPRVLSVRVTAGATVFEPSTTGSATTEFAGFLDDSAFGTYGSDSRHRHCWCWYANTGPLFTRGNLYIRHFLVYAKKKNITLHSVCRDRTFFAGLQAFGPRVLNITGASTVIKPSAIRSTTT